MTASVQLVGVYLVFASLMVPALATRSLRRHGLAVGYVIGFVGYLVGLLLSAFFDSADRRRHRLDSDDRRARDGAAVRALASAGARLADARLRYAGPAAQVRALCAAAVAACSSAAQDTGAPRRLCREYGQQALLAVPQE